MFIVDMNRKITVNVDNVIYISQDSRRITAVTKVDDIILGTYNTEERAAEVYAEMLKNIFPPTLVAKNTELNRDALVKLKCNTIVLKTAGEPEVKFYDCGIYYMPGETV